MKTQKVNEHKNVFTFCYDCYLFCCWYSDISGESTTEYGECCEDSDDDDSDCCDLSGRGTSWIIFNVIAIILGAIGAAADFGIAQVSFNGISNKFLPIVAGVLVLIAILIWEVDNPVYEDNDYSGIEAGASIFIGAVGLVFFIIAGGLEFA